MFNKEVVIAALPYVETPEPLMAPALLKGIVNKTNLSSVALDFNAEVQHFIKKFDKQIQENISRWFLYKEYDSCTKTQKKIKEIVDFTAQSILKYNPSWVCLSLFCGTAKEFNVLLCKSLKKEYNFKGKIVIGGNGVFTDESSNRPYAKILKKAKLVDHFVIGDGEEPLYNLLTGQETNSIGEESFQILQDLADQPFSDYSDYNWDLYDKKRVPMYGSRGCVRRCTFCDVYKLWKKFKIRDAEIVFQEMLYQIEKTGFRDFYFRDSLINGSISEYKKLMTLIAEYNSTNVEKIKWTSFFIFRPQSQMPEEDWKLASEGGADELVIGVESFVDSIRYHMRKKFTNADIDFGLKMAKKYDISLLLLLIIGYVNETENDFQESLAWLENHKEYATDLLKLSAGGTLVLTDLSDLYQNAEDFDITLGNSIFLWENKKINLDYATREKRKQTFIDTAKQLNYNIVSHEKPVS